MEAYWMRTARINEKGQITIPADILERLNLRAGDRVAFIDEDDRVILRDASLAALSEIQNQMRGAEESAGLSNDDDVVRVTKNIRKEHKRT
jgi:antitoxin PrlF